MLAIDIFTNFKSRVERLLYILLGMVLALPKPKSQHKEGLFAPKGQRTENKKQRQEIEDKGETEGNEGEGGGVFVPEWNK